MSSKRDYQRHKYSGKRPSKKKVMAATKQHYKVAYTRSKIWRNAEKEPKDVNLESFRALQEAPIKRVRVYHNSKTLQNDPLETDPAVDTSKDTEINKKCLNSTEIAKPHVPNESQIYTDIDYALTEDFDNSQIDYDISLTTHTINIKKVQERRKGAKKAVNREITQHPAVNKSNQPNDCNDDNVENIEDYVSENDTDSEKGNSDEENNTINLAGMNGHRIVNVRHVLIWAFSIERHRKICRDAEIEFVKEERDKFRSTYTFVCKTCNKKWLRHTEP